MPITLSPRERDLMIRTVMGEANGEPFIGKAGVAHTVLNRVNAGGYGQGVEGVLMRKAQFEPWMRRRNELLGYTPQSKGWDSAAQVVDAVAAGTLPDPTRGATHFANVATVKQRNDPAGRDGGWINSASNKVQLGRHTFMNADGRGAGRDPNLANVPAAAPPTQAQYAAGANGGTVPVQQTPAAPPVDPTKGKFMGSDAAIRPGGGLIGMLQNNNPDMTMAQKMQTFMGSGEVAAAGKGLGMLASALAPAKAPPPQVVAEPIEENRPNLSLLAMLSPKRKKVGIV